VISVQGSRELQAAVLALKVVDRSLAKDIRAATVSVGGPVWKSEVSSRARTHQDQVVLAAGARVAGGNPPTAVAGSSSKRMRGGARPSELAGGVEFGALRNVRTTYTGRSPKGTAYQVTRRTKRQFPNRTPSGRVVFPAFKETAPRMTSLWVQLIVAKVYEALEEAG